MSALAERAGRWIYRGLWAVLTDLFFVPREPPTLPAAPGDRLDRFQPAEGFLRYMKFWFWIVLAIVDLALAGAYIAAAAALCSADLWWVSLLLLPPTLFLIVAPDILAYIAIHLRYDTTWYVMTDRSLRIRRGVWVIGEVTITFENVQNVRVRSGPVQRWFGIADLVVETAGGGGGQAGKAGHGGGHQGLIEGVSNAPELRDRIMQRLRRSKTAGLGDEDDHAASHPAWTPAHIEALREIRDEFRMVLGR